jgi:predicted metal-dependent hydrolase
LDLGFYDEPVSHKSSKIEVLIAAFRDQELDAHYLAYFECFNQQLFFEAHDVLEEIWLMDRHGPRGSFYKGLIQLAGAFVHLQKNRLRPAAALFGLARENLKTYPATQDRLDVAGVLRMIAVWMGKLESTDFALNPLSPDTTPELRLQKKL